MQAFDRLVTIMTRLREECPWDKKQTHTSLLKYLLEETYEVVDAIESEDDEEICEELGDLLLQVVFHAEIARQESRFDIADICDTISDKMERRHPHVFGDTKVTGVKDVLRNWEAIKADEKGKRTLDGVPRNMPALLRAYRVQGKASKVGFDWKQTIDAFPKIEEEVAELKEALESGNPEHFEEELGDLLFAVVNVARHQHVDPERALRYATQKFQRRFNKVEDAILEQGKTMRESSLEEMDALWDSHKAMEK
jgi:tetrapyrrole methylase family protein / MazG family protein